MKRSKTLVTGPEGSLVVVPLEQAEVVRAALGGSGFAFEEGDPDDCGCGGPTAAVFRLGEGVDPQAADRCVAAALAAEEQA